MEQVAAGQFKAQCLQLMDQVQQTHQEIVITKHGRPVAKLVPVESDTKRSILGYLQDTVQIPGDIVSPLAEPWAAEV
ncbi:MAG: type II toxin-antitoxin system prevent-host-death family antitoxin [Aphanocapsa sp. GSE-SYN-MK-11-07L]|jgi:prevent-host-death family protein|nr:type II toxin-antitoxin system prevent-host-death family antitoxin [Aphanocapsa sp. GSE-SYN-MK-11-07L]